MELLALYLSPCNTRAWLGSAWTPCSLQAFAWNCAVALNACVLCYEMLQSCISAALCLWWLLALLALVCMAQDLSVAELCFNELLSLLPLCWVWDAQQHSHLHPLLPGHRFSHGGGPPGSHQILQFNFLRIVLSSTFIRSRHVLFSVEPVVKPKPAKRGGEKNAGKSRRKKNRGKNKKKGTPCEMEYKNFCIHGECIYLEHLQMVTCK